MAQELQLLKSLNFLSFLLIAILIVIFVLALLIGILVLRFMWKIDTMISQPAIEEAVPKLLTYLNMHRSEQVSALLLCLLRISRFDINDAISIMLDNGWSAYAFPFDTLHSIERFLGQSKYYKDLQLDGARLVSERFKEDVEQRALIDALHSFIATRDRYLIEEQIDQANRSIQDAYTKKFLNEAIAYLNGHAQQNRGFFSSDVAIKAFVSGRTVPGIALSMNEITPYVSYLLITLDVHSVILLKVLAKSFGQMEIVQPEFVAKLDKQVDGTLSLLYPVILKNPALRFTYQLIISPVLENATYLLDEKWMLR